MEDERQEMVNLIKKKYGLTSPEILSVMLQVPRHKFIPRKLRYIAYHDGPVSIGYGQTISQPFTVAFMTDLLELTGKEKVLEVGTGSGYQAAILSKLAKEVYTIEIIPQLAEKAKKTLAKLGYKNVKVRVGNGRYGWKEAGPFDAIIVTAGMEEIPSELFRQLKKDGILVAPIGVGQDKVMTRFTKRGKEIKKEEFGIFHFVPFVEDKN